jgi:ferritin-like metal-binding protein YciE
MPGLETLQELLVHELQDLYNAENQLIKALPKMAKRASSSDLREAFQEHLGQTEMQAQRIERALSLLDAPVKGRNCDGMQGIIEEGKKLMEEDASEDVMDAGLIASAQKVEHYEIAAYGSVKAWAELLGQDEITALMEETLEEEEATDRKLSDLAETMINAEAAMGNGDKSGNEENEEGEEGTSPRRAAASSGRGRKANTPARQQRSRRR